MAVQQMSAAPSAKATNGVTVKLDLALRKRLRKEHDAKVDAAQKQLDEAWAELTRQQAEVAQAGGDRYASGAKRLARDQAQGRQVSADAQLKIAVDARMAALSGSMPPALGRRIEAFKNWCLKRAMQERDEGSKLANETGGLGDLKATVLSLRVRNNKEKLAEVLPQYEEVNLNVRAHERRGFAYDALSLQASSLWLAVDPESGLAELSKQFEPVEKEADHAP
jgi:hypothetical protein